MKNQINYFHKKEGLKNVILRHWFLIYNIRLRAGIFFIIMGLLWLGKKLDWFRSDIFGPVAMLTFGIWLVFTYFINKAVNSYNSWISSLLLEEGDFFGL